MWVELGGKTCFKGGLFMPCEWSVLNELECNDRRSEKRACEIRQATSVADPSDATVN